MTVRAPWPGVALAVVALIASWPLPVAGAAAPPWGVVASVEATGCVVTTDLRLDHVPIAVRDLTAAGELFRSLGFTLKPGRPHDNGIANLHAKFADGTELELITAAEGVDALTREYVDFLRDGDGAAYLALYGGALDAVESRLRPLAPELWRAPGMLAFASGHRWERYFFGRLNRSPTDRPEHFEHANGARSLAEVWLADDGVIDLLAAFDAAPCDVSEARAGGGGRLVPLAAGSAVLLLPRGERVRPSRPIVGVTVRVDDAEAASRLLDGAGVSHVRRGTGDTLALVIDPSVAPGLWTELREATGWARR